MNDIVHHMDQGVLQALADGELDPADGRRVEAHLAECAACREEMDSLHQAALALTGALRVLDHPIAGAPRFRVPAARTVTRNADWASLPRAAMLVLGLGLAGAASAAVPGSPVRAWVESLIGGRETPLPAAVAEAPAPERAMEAPEAGVSIVPENGSVRIALDEVAPGVVVTATLADGARAGVFASGPAADARFTTGRGRIEVVGAAAGALRVEIPRDARSATLTLNGRVYVVKEGDRLRVDAPDAETTGTEVTFRVR